jgi:hypothetical protein
MERYEPVALRKSISVDAINHAEIAIVLTQRIKTPTVNLPNFNSIGLADYINMKL